MYCLLCGQRSEFQIPHSFFWQQHLCPEIFHISQTNPTGSLCIWEAETSSPNVTVTGGRCCIDAPVNLKVLLGKWLSFLDEQGGKNSSPSSRESSGQVYEELFRRTHLVSQMLFFMKMASLEAIKWNKSLWATVVFIHSTQLLTDKSRWLFQINLFNFSNFFCGSLDDTMSMNLQKKIHPF